MHHTEAKGALVADNIFMSFGGREVLKGVAIRMEPNKVTGLLGRNGAGKSTMLKIIFGIQKADDAMLMYKRRKINCAYTTQGLLNYLPQTSFLPPGRSMKKVLKDYGVDLAEVIGHFPELEADINKSVSELSGGSERLWSAIIVLLAETQYSLLDEPFSHIMPLHVDRLKELIKRQTARKGIVLTDHMYRHVLELSDCLYLMKDGKSIFIKDKEDIVVHGYLRHIEDVE